jgi:hypothetical protein
MMKLFYNGTDERVFPTLGITVNQGDQFDAPEGFEHPDCSASGGAKPFTKTNTNTTPSAASDPITNEVK